MSTSGLGARAWSVSTQVASASFVAILALAGGAAAGSRLAAPVGWELGVALSAMVVLSWQALWVVLTTLDWREVLTTWHGWTQGKPLPYLPYTQPGSPAEHTATELGLFATWAQRVLLPTRGEALLALGLSVASALIVSAALGERAVVLTLVALALAQGVAALSLRNFPPAVLQGLQTIALPLMLGHSLMAEPGLTFISVALALGVAYGGALSSWTVLQNIGCVAAMLILLLTRQPIGAFIVLALWAPQALLHVTRGQQVWLIAVVLAAALTFAA